MARDAAVVVAGLGPVGGVLAALLGAQGVRTVVVEPEERPYPKPRAAVLEIESIRLLSLIPGLAPRDAWSVPMTRNGAVGADRRPLFVMRQRAQAFGHPQIVRIDSPRWRPRCVPCWRTCPRSRSSPNAGCRPSSSPRTRSSRCSTTGSG